MGGGSPDRIQPAMQSAPLPPVSPQLKDDIAFQRATVARLQKEIRGVDRNSRRAYIREFHDEFSRLEGISSFDDLTIAYDRRPAVHHLSGRFEPGSLTAIVGPNGAGKSSLLKGIVGLLRPSEGQIALGDFLTRRPGFSVRRARLSDPAALQQIRDRVTAS